MERTPLAKQKTLDSSCSSKPVSIINFANCSERHSRSNFKESLSERLDNIQSVSEISLFSVKTASGKNHKNYEGRSKCSQCAVQ